MNPTFHEDYKYLMNEVVLPIVNTSNDVNEVRTRIKEWEGSNLLKCNSVSCGVRSSGESEKKNQSSPQHLRTKRLRKLAYADGACHYRFTQRYLALIKSQPTLDKMNMVTEKFVI